MSPQIAAEAVRSGTQGARRTITCRLELGAQPDGIKSSYTLAQCAFAGFEAKLPRWILAVGSRMSLPGPHSAPTIACRREFLMIERLIASPMPIPAALLLTKTEPYLDSCGMFRDAVISILAAIAQQERLRLFERVRAGLQRAKSLGTRSGNPISAMSGFRRDLVTELRKEGRSWSESPNRPA